MLRKCDFTCKVVFTAPLCTVAIDSTGLCCECVVGTLCDFSLISLLRHIVALLSALFTFVLAYWVVLLSKLDSWRGWEGGRGGVYQCEAYTG